MTRAKGRRVMTTPDSDVPASEFEDRGFFNAQDGVTGRDGGPYLDQIERVHAEQNRAFKEGREVKSTGELLNETLPAAVGTDLRVAALIPDNRLTSNPSMAETAGLEQVITTKTFTGNENLADPLTVLPVDVAGTANATGPGTALGSETPKEKEEEKPTPVIKNSSIGEPKK